MPVETIKCRECGSPEVTEFKSGSYVCGHCEAVFKYVRPAGAVVGCEIDGCGVPPVGRCEECGRALCATHGSAAVEARLLCVQCKIRALELSGRTGRCDCGEWAMRVCGTCEQPVCEEHVWLDKASGWPYPTYCSSCAEALGQHGSRKRDQA